MLPLAGIATGLGGAAELTSSLGGLFGESGLFGGGGGPDIAKATATGYFTSGPVNINTQSSWLGLGVIAVIVLVLILKK